MYLTSIANPFDSLGPIIIELWFILALLGIVGVLMIINKYKLESKVKPLRKRIIDIMYFTLPNGYVFFYDKYDKKGSFLGLLANGSMNKIQRYNGYKGYVVKLDCILVGQIYTNTGSSYEQNAVWYKISNHKWEYIQSYVVVLSNDIPVLASVNNSLYSEIKIFRST